MAAKKHKKHKMKTEDEGREAGSKHFYCLRLLLCFLCLFVAIASSASAAPPAITYLSPAGAQRGTTVEVTATGTFDASTKVWASGKGVSVEATKTAGKFSVTVAKDAVPGVHWLRAHNAEGASGLRPFVVGMLPEVAEKEPNDDFKKPHVLDGSSFTVNGKLEKSGDVDCFAVSLKKGQTLVASLEANRTLRSPMDGVLQVLSADGFVLEENNDAYGLDPQLAFTAKKDGTYIARVYAFPATPDSSIRFFGSDACIYRLTLTTGSFADFAVPLALGSQEPWDKDKFEVKGWNIQPTPVPFQTQKPGAFDTHLVFSHESAANAVRVRLENHRCFTAPDPEQDGTVKAAYAAPFSTTSRIAKKGGTTTIAFRGQKGTALSVQVESRTFGLSVNPVVRVLDAEKKQLARAEPAKLSGDTALTFTPPADGGYLVEVNDLYRGGGGPRDYFLLRVLEMKPDYDLTVATDRFALTPGKPTLIQVKVNRKNGFNKEIEIAADGLPEGVKLEMTQPAKPDPNTVTLSLTAEKSVSGPFRLVGKVKDELKLTRVARFLLPDYDEPTADLWLAPTAQEAPPKKKK
jgi:hypothetical protein